MYDFFDLIYKSWDRPIKEVKAYKVLENDNGYQIVVNALGISKDDIHVEVMQNTLHINGKTVDEDIDFTNTVRYQFNVSKIVDRLKRVDYTLKNGLLHVHLILEKETKKQIKVQYKDW